MSDVPPPPPPSGGEGQQQQQPPPAPPGGGYTPPPPPPAPPPAPSYGPPPAPGGGYVPPPPAGYSPAPAGYGGYGGYGAYGYAGQRTDGLAIASLVIGLLSLPCSLFCLGLVLGPTAAIMGFISRQRIASSGGMVGGGGLALAGMILGILGFVVSVGWFFFFVASAINNQGTATPSP